MNLFVTKKARERADKVAGLNATIKMFFDTNMLIVEYKTIGLLWYRRKRFCLILQGNFVEFTQRGWYASGSKLLKEYKTFEEIEADVKQRCAAFSCRAYGESEADSDASEDV